MSIMQGMLLALLLLLLSLWLFSRFIAWRAQLASPPEGRFVRVMGHQLHYVEAGQGPAIVLIHGLSGVSRHFTYSLLDELARTHRVIALDRPGSGYSRRNPRSFAGLDVQADVVAAFCQALSLDKPLLVGHSLGGAVALATALRHPQLTRGLALIAPLICMPQSTPKVFAALNISQPWLRRLIANTVAVPLMLLQREKVLKMVFDPEPVPADYAQRGGGTLSLRPSHFLAAAEDLGALASRMPQLQAAYAGLSVPLAILYGRQDRILDPAEQTQTMLECLPQTTLELIDGGHMLPLTQPQHCLAFILRHDQKGTF